QLDQGERGRSSSGHDVSSALLKKAVGLSTGVAQAAAGGLGAGGRAGPSTASGTSEARAGAGGLARGGLGGRGGAARGAQRRQGAGPGRGRRRAAAGRCRGRRTGSAWQAWIGAGRPGGPTSSSRAGRAPPSRSARRRCSTTLGAARG